MTDKPTPRVFPKWPQSKPLRAGVPGSRSPLQRLELLIVIVTGLWYPPPPPTGGGPTEGGEAERFGLRER